MKEEAKKKEESSEDNKSNQNEQPQSDSKDTEQTAKTKNDKAEKVAEKSEKKTKKAKVEDEEEFDIADTNFSGTEWIKSNLLEDNLSFIGWKKSISKIMKAANGTSVLKKKMKKTLRKAYEISSNYNKETRKELNTIIDEKLEKSKKIKILDDLIMNAKSQD